MTVEKISSTAQKFDGTTYYLCGQYFQRKGKRLHRMVWEYHNGPIPDGYEVHHINGNRADNDIGNLQLMEGSEHNRLHMSDPERKEKSRRDISKAREAAKGWHSTEDGEAFHSKLAKSYWEHAELRTYVCSYCGKEFQTRNVYAPGQRTFCCSRHKAYWRKESGADTEIRTCPVCGKLFAVNKYTKQVCCSQECAHRKRWGK